MSRRLKRATVVFVAVLAGAQFVRPERANPPTDPRRTIQAHEGTTRALAAVVNRSCRDCHSNGTVWPWYTRVAPVSWLMASGVAKGRKAVNVSEWAGYPPDVQQMLLAASCQDVSAGRMPGPYTLIHPETRLSAGDVDTFCAAARQAEASTARGAVTRRNP